LFGMTHGCEPLPNQLENQHFNLQVLLADLVGTKLLEQAGIEVAGIIDQDVDPVELGDCGRDRGLCVLQPSDEDRLTSLRPSRMIGMSVHRHAMMLVYNLA
jgi:hypothetical protein